MKHWFISWLDNWFEESMNKAEIYRKAIENDTPESKNLLAAFDNNTKEMIRWAEIAETDAKRFKYWSHLSQDMINCGLEELAVAYYDVKQSIEPHQLPLRPQKKLNWALNGIIEQLEIRINELTNDIELEQIRAIYMTLCELSTIGMLETALIYYQRAMSKYSNLNLPVLEEYPD